MASISAGFVFLGFISTNKCAKKSAAELALLKLILYTPLGPICRHFTSLLPMYPFLGTFGGEGGECELLCVIPVYEWKKYN